MAGRRAHAGALLGLFRPRRLMSQEQAAHLPRRHLEFPVPRSRAARSPNTFAHLQPRRDAGRGDPRRRRHAARLREPLRPSRLAAVPQRARRGTRDHLRLSQLDLRSRRQSHRRRVPPRRRRQGRHAGRLPRPRRTAPRKLRLATLAGLVFGTLSADDAAARALSRRRDRQAHPPRACARR